MAIGNSEFAAMEENTEAESSHRKESQLASDLSKNLDLAEDEKEDNQEEEGIKVEASTKKKKKKNKSRKKKKKNSLKQTDPPSIPVQGEIQEYKDDNLWRTTSEEKREMERLQKPMYNSLRQAAEVHRQVRKYMRSIVKSGMLMICHHLLSSMFQ
ncbi:Methionine aminopeptidase 2A [Cardamine amara subsp. amara]|uniref:Methionine aminopeptidase 2A n=1 Tax=Cardamine amara subsp. amara TaxID=228776 RepID=A0ABD1AW58_CARAN